MSVITTSYRANNAEALVNSLVADEYYFYLGSANTATPVNSGYSKNNFLEHTIFAKKIAPGDIMYMTYDNKWVSGTVYTQYDDTIDLSTNTNFYMTVYPADNTNGDYRIYKCLYNNNGAPSLYAPSWQIDTPNQIYTMADGYIWKYMFNVSIAYYDFYATNNLIPIMNYPTPVITYSSDINNIFVENPLTNIGYEKTPVTVAGITSTNIILSGTSLSQYTDYYTGQSVYLTYNNVSKLYKITSYSFNQTTQTGTITVENQSSFSSPVGSTGNILPSVEVTGDGSGIVAIPVFSSVLPNTIESITVITPGTGYTSAAARIVDPNFFTNNPSNVRVTLRPVLSPRGGHGNDIMQELSLASILLYGIITALDNTYIPTNVTYSTIGVVRNPTFTANSVPNIFDNRIKITLNTNPLNPGDVVTQVYNGEVIFSGTVNAVSNNDIYVMDYLGPYNKLPTVVRSDITLDPSLPIISPQNQILTISTDINTSAPLVTLPSYIQRTGEVYYMSSFAPITRTPTSNEVYKVILQF